MIFVRILTILYCTVLVDFAVVYIEINFHLSDLIISLLLYIIIRVSL